MNSCLQCQNRGVFMAFLKDNGKDELPGPFAFKCGCSFGRMDIRAYPLWRPSDAHRFEPISGVVAKADKVLDAPEEPRKPSLVECTMPGRVQEGESLFDESDEEDLF